MSETLGSLIDRLTIVNLKMWNRQEILYRIRHMTYGDFHQKFCSSEKGSKKLWGLLQKACDLNFQRNILIDEVDKKVVSMIRLAVAGDNLEACVQRKHKTY